MSPGRVRREVQPHLVPLGAALRRARELAQLSGNQLAKNIGWGQTKVSLIEAGRQTPTEGDVRAWAAGTDADVVDLLGVREHALVRHLDVREAARRPGGANTLAGDLEGLERPSGLIAEYQPTVIPGLLQTPDYLRAWITQPGRVEIGDPPDVDDVVARRQSRQRTAAGKRMVAAFPVGVLTAVYGSGAQGVAVQRAQLDTLAAAITESAAEVIVTRTPIALLHGFELLDDAVVVETVDGLHVMADPQVVVQFRVAFDRLRRGGLTGKWALREIEVARTSLGR